MHFERHALFWTAAALLFAYIVQLIAPALVPFVIGLTLAYFLAPVVDWMARAGIPRWVSAIILLAAITCVIGLVFVFVVPILVQQAMGLIEAAPRELARLGDRVEALARDHLGYRYPQAENAVRSALESVSTSAPAIIGTFVQEIWKQSSAAVNFFTILLITPVVFFYVVVDWPKMIAKIDSWLPRDGADQIRGLFIDIDSRISAFIRGQGLVCILLALFYSISLTLAGLDYGLLVGSLTGLAAFIPIFGWALGALTTMIIAFIQYWPDITHILIIVGILLAGEALESAILSPYIIGSEVGLHPVWVIFALMAFSYLFGFLGLLVAVPVSAAIGVLVRFALRSYLESSIYRGEVDLTLKDKP